VFRIKQPESEETELSDSSVIVSEPQQSVKETELLERERKELKQYKLLVARRQQELQTERANIASPKNQRKHQTSPEPVNKQARNEQLEAIAEQRLKAEQKLDETEKLKTHLAKLGGANTQELAEIGRDGSFIAYEDGTILDTKTNLMWWSKSFKEVNGMDDAHSKSQMFRGGGHADWRLPSTNELKTIYNKSSKLEYKTINFITLTTSHLIANDPEDTKRRASAIRVLNFENGRAENITMKDAEKASYLPVRRAD
jgi:hypothetical protein